MDAIDQKLIALLQRDCTLAYHELGRRVGLSVTAVRARLAKLRGRGDIRAYVALIRPEAIGLEVCAFVLVAVRGAKNDRKFLNAVVKFPEVEECHVVTGDYSLLLKVRARDLKTLNKVLNRKVKTLPGVAGTQVMIVLSSARDKAAGV